MQRYAVLFILLVSYCLLGSCSRPAGLRAPGGGTGGGSGGGSGGKGGGVVIEDRTLERAGLSAIAAGKGTALVTWIRPKEQVELALFSAASSSGVYAKTSSPKLVSGTSLLVTGLTDGTAVYFGLGLRRSSTAAFEAVGEILRVVPGAPIYVNHAASSVGADGKSPATAYPKIASAVFDASLSGSANIWVAAGTYDEAPLVLSPGTRLFGGFSSKFLLGARDPSKQKTIIRAANALAVLTVANGTGRVVIDGVEVDGGKTAALGVDSERTPLELRSVYVHDCRDRGFRLRNISLAKKLSVRVTSSVFESNGADGINLFGAYDLSISNSDFLTNVQEGVECDDLIAFDGGKSSLTVSGCRFLANGAEGLDCDLVAPLATAFFGGSFTVSIENSTFEGNGLAGLLIDQDHELAPKWAADVLVQNCSFRANRGAGIALDADAAGRFFFHRLLSTANAGDGLLVTSEIFPGIIPVAASVFAGNLGAGIRASQGQRGIAASHCIFAGNAQGGVRSEVVESGTSSSIFYKQPAEVLRTTQHANVSSSSDTFLQAPLSYARILAQTGKELKIDLGAASKGDRVEIADDGVPRTVELSSNSVLTLDTAPAAFLSPGLLSIFDGGVKSVIENYKLTATSPAKGMGMTGKGAAATDSGVFGAPLGAKPGPVLSDAPELFRFTDSSPRIPEGILKTAPLRIEFSDAVDGKTATLSTIRAFTTGETELALTIAVSGNALTISPPASGWGSAAVRLELHRGLRSTSGIPLAVPAALFLHPK